MYQAHIYRGMDKWDYHKFFDTVYDVLLDQKYLNGINCLAISEEPEANLEEFLENEPSASNVRYTIR